MGLFRKLRELIDPINRMTPAQIVRSVPSVWARVPICICTGYYDNKTTQGDIVDYDAMMFAIAGTDVQVYGRDQASVLDGKPFKLAAHLYSQLKDGTEKEKLEDATMVLLAAEMVKGGTNISVQLGSQSADLGFIKISKPLIGKILEVGYPPTEEILAKVIEEAIAQAMSFTG